MSSAPDVVVIGAGPAGLAAAAELGRMGIPSVVLEQAGSVGASWRGRYDRLRLNTCQATSRLPRSRYPAHTALFPSRDDVISYLEDYAARHVPGVRFGTRVERIDRHQAGWELHTSAGLAGCQARDRGHRPRSHPAHALMARTRPLHRPPAARGRLPQPAPVPRRPGGRRRSRLLGLEIAYDLAEGGAERVRVCIRTQPNIMLRQSGGLPGDLPAIALLRLPPRIADTQALLVRRLSVGDLRQYGLTPPAEGIFTRLRRQGKAPAIVDKEIIQAIRTRRIEITASIESLDQTSLVLTGGTRIEADVLIAATGYTPGLEPLAGHLGVLDQRGLPRRHGGQAAAPGLRFIGYLPRPGQIGQMGREARRAARAIKNEISPATPGPAR